MKIPPSTLRSEQRHSLHALRTQLSDLGLAPELFDFNHVTTDHDALWAPTEESGRSARCPLPHLRKREEYPEYSTCPLCIPVADRQRASEALGFLLARPETHIAVVSHTNFIRQVSHSPPRHGIPRVMVSMRHGTLR